VVTSSTRRNREVGAGQVSRESGTIANFKEEYQIDGSVRRWKVPSRGQLVEIEPAIDSTGRWFLRAVCPRCALKNVLMYQPTSGPSPSEFATGRVISGSWVLEDLSCDDCTLGFFRCREHVERFKDLFRVVGLTGGESMDALQGFFEDPVHKIR
jgi:hypothetical protein